MQGYIVLACDKDIFRDMAVNLAYSLRVFDPERSIALAYNNISITDECKLLFDHLIPIDSLDGFVGSMNKLRLYETSPYDKTMYLDADMLLMRPNIRAYWKALNGNYFSMTGDKRISGRWYKKDIAKIVREFKIPYLVCMNSGVFYFERSRKAEQFFERAHDILKYHRESLSIIHNNRSGQYADEPILGVAMGEEKITPMPTLEGHGSWMVTTWRSRGHVFDPERGVCYLQKSTGYRFRQQWLSRGWVDHSPNFVHFIHLKPRAHYEGAAAWFRERRF